MRAERKSLAIAVIFTILLFLGVLTKVEWMTLLGVLGILGMTAAGIFTR